MYHLSGIYKIVNKNTGKVYVGSTVALYPRWKKHKNALAAGKHTNTLLQNSYNKHGKDAFYYEALEWVAPEDLFKREQHYIDLYKAADRQFGYNLKKTAIPSGYMTYSEERGLKMSESSKNRTFSPEFYAQMYLKNRDMPEHQKQRLRVLNIGRKQSAETIEKRRQSSIGRVKSAQECANISRGKKGKRNCKGYIQPKLMLDTRTGIFYDGLVEAAFALDVAKCTAGLWARGKCKSKTFLITV